MWKILLILQFLNFKSYAAHQYNFNNNQSDKLCKISAYSNQPCTEKIYVFMNYYDDYCSYAVNEKEKRNIIPSYDLSLKNQNLDSAEEKIMYHGLLKSYLI